MSLHRKGLSGALSGDEMNPLAIIIPVVIVAVAIMIVTRRRSASAAEEAAKSVNNTSRKMLLSFVINILENDMMRRGVIMGLKMARSRM